MGRIVNLDGFITFIASKEIDSTTILCWNWIESRRLIKENITRGNYKVQIESLRQNYSHCYLKEFSATTIAGNPAHKIEFTATDDKEEKCKAMLIWTLKDEKAHLFT